MISLGRVVALAGACSLLIAGHASIAAPERASTPVLAGPAAKFYGYASPVIVTEKNGKVSFTNLDLERHDVVQDVAADGEGGPDNAPWCRDKDGHHHEHEGCPLFWSKLIGLGQTTKVRGLARVEPGDVYSFFCTLHHGMKGKLIVQP